jgi:predicted alpha/beta superfamily hydrolase
MSTTIKLFVVFMSVLTSTITQAKLLDFIVNVPFLTPDKSTIFITGNISELGNWKADALIMNAIGNGSYALSVQVPDTLKTFHYKITRGNFETEAADSYSKAYNEISIDLSTVSSPIVQNVIHWKDLAPLVKSSNVVGPFNFYSTELGTNKEISVYLPASYDTSQKNYPVIYMHDGQNVFDPTTSTFGIKWGIDETMNKLIFENKINEAIVVAIHTNNTDRYNEYDYFIKGKNYSDFVVNSVVTYTEKNFRAIPNKQSRFLMGSSMGALISLMMIIDRPDVFSKAAGLSFPAFIHERAIFKFLDSKATLPDFDFYMDHGDYGTDARYAPAAAELYNTLLKRGVSPQHLKYLVFPYANHSEVDWARRAFVPLEYLLN